VAKALEELGSGEPGMLDVEPVKPRVETSAGEVIRELRAGAA